MDKSDINEVDEINEVILPIEEKKEKPSIFSKFKKEKPEETKEDFEKKRKEALRTDWEKHLGGVKILSKHEYRNLTRANTILKTIKYVFIAVFLIILIVLLFNLVDSFKNKDFTKETIIEINNTVNPETNTQNYVNITEYSNITPNIYLNLTVNINEVIKNGTNNS